MPKPLHKIQPEAIEQLKTAIAERAGFAVHNINDCKVLSALLLQELSFTLSVSTLYRFFFNHNKRYTCYTDTLDKLSKFVGFSNWQSFEQSGGFSLPIGISSEARLAIDSFGWIPNAIHYKEYQTLYHYLMRVPLHLNEGQKIAIVKALFRGLLLQKNNLTFYKMFSKVPAVRRFFFEEGVDPDFTISDYEVAWKYYLEGVSPNKSSKDLQDYVFAHSLLFRYYYKKNWWKKAEACGKKLFSVYINSKMNKVTIDVFPAARFKSMYFLFAGMNNTAMKKFYEDELIKFFFQSAAKQNILGRRILFYNTMDALIISGASDKSLKRVADFAEDFIPVKKGPNRYQKMLEYAEPNGMTRLLRNPQWLRD